MRRMSLQTACSTAKDEARSGYRSGGRSPIGIGGAVAIHALAIGIFLLMPKEMIRPFTGGTLDGYNVPEPAPPPPEQATPEKQAKAQPESGPTTSAVKPVVDTPADPFVIKEPARPNDPGNGTATVITPPVAPTLPDPVLVDASIDPRALAAFQPDYPGAMVRQGMEGKVLVRVTIGTDGRVVDIERLSATDEAFWLATQRHALRKWRFSPATRDGVAVSSTKILTVHFRLSDV